MSWKKKTKKYCAMSLIGDYLSTENNSQALEYTNDCLSFFSSMGRSRKGYGMSFLSGFLGSEYFHVVNTNLHLKLENQFFVIGPSFT